METVAIANLNDPSHAKAIIDLLNEYAKDEMGGGAELAEFVKHNLITELASRPHLVAILAFAGHQPVGLAICVEGFSTFACKPLLNIHDIIVAPGFRGRGISKKILSAVEALAKSRNCCKITLEVLEANQVAKNAYQSFGFEGYELGNL